MPETNKQAAPKNFDGDPNNGNGTGVSLSYFKDFKLPARLFSQALLQTQRDATAFFTANRQLVDEMHAIMRREQDLALELFENSVSKMCKAGWVPDRKVRLDPKDANELFDRAAANAREITEAWLAAHLRLLEAMRANSHGEAKAAPESKKPSSSVAEAA